MKNNIPTHFSYEKALFKKYLFKKNKLRMLVGQLNRMTIEC